MDINSLIFLKAAKAITFDFYLFFPKLKEVTESFKPISSTDFLSNKYDIDFLKEGKILSLGKVKRDVLKDLTSTFRLKSMQTKNIQLKKLADSLYEDFNLPTNINLYISHSNQEVNEFHQDNFSLIIWQVHGKKKWEFNYGSETETITLKKGDFLFVPSNTNHRTYAVDDYLSEHCTFSIYQNNLNEVLLFIKYAIDNAPDFFDQENQDTIAKIISLLEQPNRENEFKKIFELHKLQLVKKGLPHIPRTSIDEDS